MLINQIFINQKQAKNSNQYVHDHVLSCLICFIMVCLGSVMLCWLIIYMQSKSALRLWEANELQSRHLFPSQSQNRLRKSLQNVKSLRLDLFKIRTSFSNASRSCLEYPSPLRKINSTALITHKTASGAKQPGKAGLKDKLQTIQKKLKAARRAIESESEPSDAKTIRKNLKGVKMVNSVMRNSPSLETQRFKEKSRLASLTAAASKPQAIRPMSHNPYCGRNNRYYVSEVVRAVHEKNSLAMQHISQSMQMLLQYKLYKINQEQLLEEEKILLPTSPQNQNKKTLILDLDETLIHCFEKNECEPDIKLTINIDGFPFEIGFNIRPYAISFLKKMKKKWEIVVFTASHQSYADTILNEIDPDRTLFDHRLYRQHCRELTTDLFVKDLSKINRSLERVVLVDNSAYSYAMQLDNGVPILPFYEGKDFELTALEHYIQRLADCPDVRVLNREYFQLQRYTSFDTACALVKELYFGREGEGRE